ncbi:MAG: hypothetical protein IPJ69_08385 [Deltaproteobacteria bacterium]|nr:MAG: hypothetical protein IPJ69_08385 [Deltaproteobacteria bacterium]
MGAVHHRARNTADGQHIATTTWNYYQAHTHRERMIGIIQDHYPVSSRGIHLEYYDVREEQSPYLPSTDIISNLPIIRTYETLARSSNPREQEMARAMSGAVADINNQHPLDETVRLEDLERETHFIHHTYGNPLDREHPHPLFQFLNRVQETQHRDLENNPGFQARRRLQESLSSIETLHQSLRVLENASSESLPPLALQQTREDLLRRLQVSGQEISQEVNRLEALRQHSHPVRSGRGSSEIDGEIEPSPEEVRLRQLQQENTVMQNRVVAMTHNDPHILQNLTEAVRFTLRSDEEQARLLINSELHEANNPELTDEMRRVQTQNGNFSDVGVRLEHYQSIMGQMDTALLQESIRSRIEMYRTILPQIRTGDYINTWASAAQGGTSDFASRYEELIHRYENIGEDLNAGRLDQARHDFIQLEQAQVGQELQDHHVFTGRLQAGLSLGIVAAAAATMNAAGLLLLPETALTIEAGEAALGTRLLYTAATTPAFQLAHYAASDVLLGTNNLHDSSQTGAENLERYGEDYIRNFGNNVFIGETLRLVQQTAYARIAERQLIHEGTFAANSTRSATEISLIQARAARVAQDGLTSTAVNTAAIVPELAAVQTWGFAERNFSDIYHSRFDLSRATNETLNSTQALQDNALFILGMRVGHLTTSPILGRLHGAAREVALSRVRGRYEAAVRTSQEAGQAWNRYFTQGEGRGSEVRDRLRAAVAARQRLEQHVAVRDIVTAEEHAQTQQLVDALAQANDMRLSNPFRSPGLGLTFSILGADGGLGGAIFGRTPSRRSTPSSVGATTPSLPQNSVRESRTGRISATRPDPRLPISSTVAIGASAYTPPPQTESTPQIINLGGHPLHSGERRNVSVLRGASAHLSFTRSDDGRLLVNNQTGVPVTVWHTSGAEELIPASQRRLDFPLNVGDHVIVGEGDTARHFIVHDTPTTTTHATNNTRPTTGPETIPFTQPIATPIYNFCNNPLASPGERPAGLGYLFNPGERSLTITHSVGARNNAKLALRNQAREQNIPITEISETEWRLGGADGAVVHFQAINPEHTRRSDAAPTSRPMRPGPHALMTNPLLAAVWGLAGGIGPSGPLGNGRPLPVGAPITITGNPNQPSPGTIGGHSFEIVRATKPNSQESYWTFSNSTLPSGHRWRVVRQGSEVTDPNTLRSGFREGDQVSLVKNSWLGMSETIVGRFIFHDPLAQLPAQAMSTPSPSAQPSRSSPQLPGIESLPVMRRPDSKHHDIHTDHSRPSHNLWTFQYSRGRPEYIQPTFYCRLRQRWQYADSRWGTHSRW